MGHPPPPHLYFVSVVLHFPHTVCDPEAGLGLPNVGSDRSSTETTLLDGQQPQRKGLAYTDSVFRPELSHWLCGEAPERERQV